MDSKHNINSLLGIRYPILQGPFGGGLSSVKLVAAVSDAGGLGGYGGYQLEPQALAEIITDIRNATNKPFNINLWVNDTDAASANYTDDAYLQLCKLFEPIFKEQGLALPPKPANAISKFEQQAEVVLRMKPAVFSFVFGIPDTAILQDCRKLGIKTIGAATTIDEAIALEEAGVDAIVASGFEAGGHRPSFLKPAYESLHGTFALTRILTEHLNTPIIAAGGIADAKGVRAAMALGAAGVQVGTAFLATDESGASDKHKEALTSDKSRQTTLTKVYTGRLGRVLTNTVTLLILQDASTAPFPLQTTFMSTLRKHATEKGNEDLIAYWGGQIAAITKRQTAQALMQELIAGLD
ncbi:MAG TPA: nitronate monooxygenase [Flavipsychrobacter sp.]|nr:nitronate monooxygenase [Flavipsychrobacter sp.]